MAKSLGLNTYAVAEWSYNPFVANADDLIRQGKLDQIFKPEFLSKVDDFNTLRFMDWMKANFVRSGEWRDRITTSTPVSQWLGWDEGKGVPVEVMVALANKVNINPWFNLPVNATDEYVRNFASYVRDNLKPGLQAYVELSNEVWNWGFPQAQYAKQQGEARGINWQQWYGQRTAEMSKIWKDTFGSQVDRTKTVMGIQTGWPGLEDYSLNQKVNGRPAASYVDVLAMTGYFSGMLPAAENVNVLKQWMNQGEEGFRKVFQQLRSGGLLPKNGDSISDTINSFKHFKGIADKYGLQLAAYEGGPHLTSYHDDSLTNWFGQINRRPEMKQLLTDLFNGWKQSGGALFTYYADIDANDKYGQWGAFENLNQTTTPKYDALIDFMNQNSPWWGDRPLPTPSPSPNPTPNPTPSPSPTPSPTPPPLPTPDSLEGFRGAYFNNNNLQGNPTFVRRDRVINFDWGNATGPGGGISRDNFSVRWSGKVNVPTNGNYTFFGTTDDGMRLFVDGQKVIDRWQDQAATEAKATVNLGAGQHTIRMEYFDRTWNAAAKLEWAGPNLSRQNVVTASSQT